MAVAMRLGEGVKKSRKWKAESLKKKRLIHGFGAAGRDALPEDLKKQDTREEVAYASPSQKLEQNVPRTPWDFKSQPHEDVASSREYRLRKQGSADRVAGEKFIGEFAVGLGAGSAGVVFEDGFAVARCLADADRAWDHCAIDLLGEVV
jgi:hypothetical protein